MKRRDKRFTKEQRTEFASREEAFKEQISTIANSRYFASEKTAETYLTTALSPYWRELLHVPEDEDDRPISDILEMTPTMVLLVRLHAQGVHRIGAKTKTPRFRYWRPAIYKDEALWYPRALSASVAGKILGKSVSAVEEAQRRLADPDGPICVHRLVIRVSAPTGVLLDIANTPQFSFNFMLAEYQSSKLHLENVRLDDSRTMRPVMDHLNEAIDVLGATPRRTVEVSDEKVSAE